MVQGPGKNAANNLAYFDKASMIMKKEFYDSET
jgi:hypothetical protein